MSCCRNGRFCDSHRSPTAERRACVQNPCPKSTSHNYRCQRVVRRSAAWDTCSAMPVSPPPTSTPSSRSTPSSGPAATGSSPRPPVAPTPNGPPSPRPSTRRAPPDRPPLTQVLGQLRPGDTLVVWKLDRLGRSLRHLVDTVTGLAERGVGCPSL